MYTKTSLDTDFHLVAYLRPSPGETDPPATQPHRTKTLLVTPEYLQAKALLYTLTNPNTNPTPTEFLNAPNTSISRQEVTHLEILFPPDPLAPRYETHTLLYPEATTFPTPYIYDPITQPPTTPHLLTYPLPRKVKTFAQLALTTDILSFRLSPSPTAPTILRDSPQDTTWYSTQTRRKLNLTLAPGITIYNPLFDSQNTSPSIFPHTLTAPTLITPDPAQTPLRSFDLTPAPSPFPRVHLDTQGRYWYVIEDIPTTEEDIPIP